MNHIPSDRHDANKNYLQVWHHPSTSINFSDIIQNETIDDVTRTDESFDINKRPFRSATLNGADADVDVTTLQVVQSLENNTVHEIYHSSERPLNRNCNGNGNVNGNSEYFDITSNLLKENFKSADEVNQTHCIHNIFPNIFMLH